MSPKAINYKGNSVIYFQNDKSDRIYILKSGKISLNSKDIETGQEVHDPIQTGEFFGVKSALGKYPREESAMVLTDSMVLAFTVQEFEQLAGQNTRIIMKMLKVFSNQLRRLHKRVRNLISMEDQVEPEAGLYQIGEYYLLRKQYKRAEQVFKRYQNIYPAGEYKDKVAEQLKIASHYADQYGQGRGPAIRGVEEKKSAKKPKLNAFEEVYYNGVNSFTQGNYVAAIKEFKRVLDECNDPNIVKSSQYEIGRCLFQMQKYDAAIKHFSTFLQNYPKSQEIPDALFSIGKSYEEKGTLPKAEGFYKKILSLDEADTSLKRKVKKSLQELEGKKR